MPMTVDERVQKAAEAQLNAEWGRSRNLLRRDPIFLSWGYEDLLQKLCNTEHPDHGDAVEWLGVDFDPKELDIAEVNAQLRCIRL